MKLVMSSWLEIEDYLKTSDGVIIPTGSIEQHGPMGLIGTDMICADEIASEVAKQVDALITPPIAYAPAEFNMDFPGTISLPSELYQNMCLEIFRSLERHGFRHIYILNGHGANLEPLNKAAEVLKLSRYRIKSWWEFKEVNDLRQRLYGEREGMHATPSEVSITQFTHRTVRHFETGFRKLETSYYQDHAGDNHQDAAQHRSQFPTGAVGSDPTLANSKDGKNLLELASNALVSDYTHFTASNSAGK